MVAESCHRTPKHTTEESHNTAVCQGLLQIATPAEAVSNPFWRAILKNAHRAFFNCKRSTRRALKARRFCIRKIRSRSRSVALASIDICKNLLNLACSASDFPYGSCCPLVQHIHVPLWCSMADNVSASDFALQNRSHAADASAKTSSFGFQACRLALLYGYPILLRKTAHRTKQKPLNHQGRAVLFYAMQLDVT